MLSTESPRCHALFSALHTDLTGGSLPHVVLTLWVPVVFNKSLRYKALKWPD